MATNSDKAVKISQKHLLGIQDLSVSDINFILSGAIDPRKGKITLDGKEIQKKDPDKILKMFLKLELLQDLVLSQFH